jgi:predicted CoA-binding protein
MLKKEIPILLNYEQVKAISETPLQEMLLPMIRVSTPLLLKLDLSILSTTDVLGFITSDNPCVWFDSEAYKRPPFYRGPALMYETIEITLPVSPRQSICLNRKGIKDYLAIPGLIVDEINRRTRFLAERFFVARKNQKKEIWFDPGVEPEDSWEKMQNKKISGSEETEKSRP